MERKTGASDAQIERATQEANMSWGFGEGMPHVLGPEIRQAASFLVHTDERIVLADDLDTVTTTLLSWADDDIGGKLLAAVNRIRAAIGTPTAPVCPRCGERTVESPRTGRTCVISECGWRERES